jgi:predicted amidohydrolase YtcJ
VLDADVTTLGPDDLASVEVLLTFLGGRLVHGEEP